MAGSADTGQEFSGKSVDEAIAEGLAALRLTREQAEIEVINKGSRGIFGLGSEPARVLIRRRSSAAASTSTPPKTTGQAAPSGAADQVATGQPPQPSTRPTTDRQAADKEPPAPPVEPKTEEADASEEPSLPVTMSTETTSTGTRRSETAEAETTDEEVEISDDELAAMAVELLQGVVERMGFEAEVTAGWHDEDDENGNNDRYLRVDINGSDVSPLIGRRGETLASLQYLVRLMVNQRIKQWKNIVVDVDQYKERRVTQLTQLAHRMADQVTESGRAVSLEPMPPHERRIVHLALRDHASVYTQSSGEGERRKVHIVAKD